jgi:hypothetical protein
VVASAWCQLQAQQAMSWLFRDMGSRPCREKPFANACQPQCPRNNIAFFAEFCGNRDDMPPFVLCRLAF